MKVKKGDMVRVLAGKDKGEKGKVILSIPKRDQVVVEGLNMRKRHQKPRKAGQAGQVVSFEAPLHVSNVVIDGTKRNKRETKAKTKATKK